MTQRKESARTAKVPKELPEDINYRPPKEILEEARKFIGTETEASEGRYAVEYDPIRRYCHMSGDTNPLYLDPEYARKTKHGEVVCPALMIGYFSGQGIWPPREGPRAPRVTLGLPSADAPRRIINLATEWTFYKTVKVGDHLSTKNKVADVYMKAIRSDPEAIWTATDRIITNQDGEVVAVGRNTLLSYKK